MSELTLPQTYIDSSTQVIRKEPNSITEADDYDDFHAAPLEIPEPQSIVSPELDPQNNSFEPLHFVTDITSPPLPQLTVAEDQMENKKDSKLCNEILQKGNEDDEFTEFQSSIPTSLANSILYSDLPLQANSIPYITTFSYSQPNIAENPPPMPLEPLKPILVHQKPNELTPAQINWPDPGVTDEEIKKFEEIFSTTVEKSSKTEQNIPKADINIVKQNISKNSLSNLETQKNLSQIQKTTESDFPIINIQSTKTSKYGARTPSQDKLTKNGSFNEIWGDFIKPCIENHVQIPENTKMSGINKTIDDDEWTDFVSAQKPSPIHKLAARETERTSSPDLPLSVFNLGSVQPAKQPIPVITPQGLVQTKLSASSINASPKFPHKNTKQLFQPFQNIPMVTPSIISNQYVSQAYNTSSVATEQQSASHQGMKDYKTTFY